MDDNAWDMRYEVPGGEYGLFVARYILREEVGPPWIDPFALDVAYEDLRSVYIARPDVEKEVVGFGTRIVLGREGTGKTTLSSMWKHLLPPTTFVVRVPILELGTADREETLLAGQASLLTPELLIPCIWNAYWDDLLCNSRNRARFLPRLRQDRGWMRRLRCFYRRFPPLWPEIDGEFELMSWLRVVESDEILSPAMAPEAALCELLGLVAYAPLPAGRFSAPFIPPYRQVHLLIDGVEDLSPSGTSRLLRDLHRLYVLYRGSLDLTLFLDSGLEVQVKETDCVRQGRVTLCYLPRWQKGQLEEMLA
ncbi:MAG: hypothetical protein GX597_15275, partial [Anaerolineaceae bacterium]|nr:hypothetical protein [Anaerolineaceae bacterium]